VPIKVRDAAKVLQDKGFREEKDRDHVYYFFLRDGKKTGISTKISHSERDLTDGLCGFMAKQLRLTMTQFRNLIECPLTYKLYLDHLVNTGYLKPLPQVTQATPASGPKAARPKR
jgi:hypothetical protein